VSILVAGTDHPILAAIARLLREQGQSIVSLPDRRSIADRLREFPEVEILCISGTAPIGAAVMDVALKLRALVSPFIGVEGFDIAAATARGVLIANGQTEENIESMAEAAVMLTLAAAYDLPGSLEAMRRKGLAHPMAVRARMLKPMTVGIVGYGRIGQSVARLLSAFQCSMLIHAPRLHAPLPLRAQQVELRVLAESSDVIIVLASLTVHTRHLIDAQLIALMKPNVTIINVARGGLIDEVALAQAALAGRIGRLVLDVFEHEPLAADSPLRTLPDVMLTPHCVGHTCESEASLPPFALQNIERLLRGELPLALVNPQALPLWKARAAPV
jgi:phosphoglycerate dehydrogenase-like enzyme